MKSSNTQTQTSSQTTQPWAQAIPLLSNIIGKYSGLSTDVTPTQQAGADKLTSEASGIPDFSSYAFGSLPNFFNADSTAPQIGMLSDAYNTLKSNLAPTTDPNNVNPMNTPGFSDALNTAIEDTTNAVKGVYAGSGRDPSGAGSFAKTLGRGITQGIAPTIAAQFNANRGAQNAASEAEFGAGGSTAGAITGQQEVPLSNAAQGTSLIPGATSTATLPGSTQLAAGTTSYGLPFGNLAALLQPALGLGSLGTQSSGTSTTSQPQSAFSNIMGGLLGGTGILSNMGAFGSSGWLAPMMAGLPLLSDERAKDDIEEVGELHDGQPIYRFRYKGDPTTHIGLLAQEVAEQEPDAVVELPDFGLLAVDYKMATDRAAEMGAHA